MAKPRDGSNLKSLKSRGGAQRATSTLTSQCVAGPQSIQDVASSSRLSSSTAQGFRKSVKRKITDEPETYVDENLLNEDIEEEYLEDFEDEEDEEVDDEDNSEPSPTNVTPTTASTVCTGILTARPTVPDIPFTRNPGIIPDINNFDHPRNFFDLLVDSDFVAHIVKETNDHAVLLESLPTQRKIKKWTPLTPLEFLTFLGMLYHMGTVVLPKIVLYWAKDPKLLDFPSFRRCMSRDRFLQIFRFLHFSPNPKPDEPNPADRLYKVRPLLKYFHDKMDEVVVPEKNLCIDESMLLWRGRLIFRQYLKNKTHPCGIKIYKLTDSKGLVLRMIVFTGASDPAGKGHTDEVVRSLMQGHLDVGHELFMDSYYTSLGLVQYLLGKNTYTTGTLSANLNGNPNQILFKKLKKDEVAEYFTDDRICILKWKDKNDALMISSKYTGKKVVYKNRQGVEKEEPEAFVRYNQLMGRVDKFDQMMAYYPIQRKTLRWYKKLGIHILHILLVNSYVLYNRSSLPKLKLLDYRNNVIRTLLPDDIPIPATPQRHSLKGIKGLSKHSIAFNEEGSRNAKKNLRCRVCYKNSIVKRTVYHCPACPEKPGLCPVGCFAEYHKDMKLEDLYKE